MDKWFQLLSRFHAIFTVDHVGEASCGHPMLQLKLPEPVGYRRAFRKFGSDAFIFVRVKQAVVDTGACGSLLRTRWRIAGRDASFLQGKDLLQSEQSVLLFCPKPGLTVEQFRRWHIPPNDPGVKGWCVGKEAARWDLAFSDTRFARYVDVKDIEVVEDKIRSLKEAFGKQKRDAAQGSDESRQTAD